MRILINDYQYGKIVEEHNKFEHYSKKDLKNLLESERAEIETSEDIQKILNKAAESGGLTQQSEKRYTYSKEVEALQTALLLLKYKLPEHGIDGKYGPETAKAVSEYENSLGLKKESYNSIIRMLIDESMVELGSYEKNLENVERMDPPSGSNYSDKLPSALLDDIQKAASMTKYTDNSGKLVNSGITVTIHYAKTGHRKKTKRSKVTSRHWKEQAVDISYINGISVKNSKVDKLADEFVKNLEGLGYRRNSERGNPKAVLWKMRDHYDHFHVSNTSDSSQEYVEPKVDTKQPESSQKKVTNNTGESIGKESLLSIVKKLIDKNFSKEDIKKVQQGNSQEESSLPKKTEKKTDVKTEIKPKENASTTTDKEYIIIESKSKTQNYHVLFGGSHTNSSYSRHGANLSAMKNYVSVLNPYANNVNIVITHHMNTLDSVKKYVKDNFNGTVTSIAGFSQGGKETWRHAQDSSLKFVGLIDPSTYAIDEKLGPNTYMICNPNNWGSKGFVGDVKKRLKWYCEHQSQYGSHLECVKINHWGCLSYFYGKYSSRL